MLVFEPLGILSEDERDLENQIPVRLMTFRNLGEKSLENYNNLYNR